ncbi:MAG: galactose-1-phosphate uridylyltransferase [Verrucomicrobia bacterium]|nr:galactose-1-phosphate uridylyltransferase [Verrucomicrobiota bacterium]
MSESIHTLWENRWHPLRQEWVMIAAHRQDRPWVGEVVGSGAPVLPAYSPECTLCPRNVRVSGVRNDDYAQTFVFDNDHPCVSLHAPDDLPEASGIYRNEPAKGVARVVCFSPRHDLTLAEMAVEDVEQVLYVWKDQFEELGRLPEIKSIHMFENKGEVVGVSNPHPHGQIYAAGFVFKTIEIEIDACEKHAHETGRVLFADIIAEEQRDGRRIVCENEHAIAFIPYFARYAYEIFIAPKKAHADIRGLSGEELSALADIQKRVLVRLDNLWRMSFPHIMAFHQAPTDGGDYSSFHFHIEIHPPLRKPNVLKYLAGAEVGAGNFLSDTIPEEKAAELRALPEVHYKEIGG